MAIDPITAKVGISVATSIASSILGSMNDAKRRKAEKRRILAQKMAKFRQEKAQLILDVQNTNNNYISIAENKMRNDFLIEESKLEAEDDFAQAFAGSGVSGRTKDIMEADMESDVGKAHTEAGKIATNESDRQFLGLMRSRDKLESSMSTLYTADVGSTNNNLAMMQAGISVAGIVGKGYVDSLK